ncbi:MAG: methyltransferase domain-containing protein [Candidatus Cloacimonetes bacterium]|nr:methyltransferase domain-containing protein [Candidatus Cloacimonadota bacterium]
MINTKYINPYMHDTPKTKYKVKDAKLTADFIGYRDFGKVLDIGCRNPKGEYFEKYYKIKLDNIVIDLDIGKLYGSYDTVFCFEVIEHLFNPLHLLLEIRKILKDNGKLFLTTPRHKPYFLRCKRHFHEFYKVDLVNLIKRAEFKIVRFQFTRRRELWRWFFGFRPFLRLIFGGTFYIELEKEI